MTSDIKFYLTLLKRRLPVMLLLFLMASIAGVVMSQRLPTMYETSAKLLVEDAQISEGVRGSNVQAEAAEQLEVIQQRLLTRVNLLDIARETQAIPELNTMTPDEIVTAMREATSVRRSSGRDRATLMTIQFEGGNPNKVAAVVNRYVTIVLDESVDARVKEARARLEFFEVELENLSAELDEQSAKIVAFKSANSDALPENLSYRLNRQSSLQEALQRAERDLDSAITQRDNIERIFKTNGTLELNSSGPRTIEEQELEQLKSRMREFNALSVSNPRVRNLQTRIEALTKIVEEQKLEQLGLTQVNGEQSPQASALDISLGEYDARITALRSEIESTTAELAQINDMIERTPVNGITLAAMEREQENIQNLYSAAVSRLAQARMAERITTTANGERITVIESANVPSTPSSPNRPAVMALGLGVGLGLAAGLFLLLELLNQSIRRPVDVERALEITPLATIPRIESLGRKRLRRFNQILILLSIVVGVPVALWAIDTYYLPLDLIFEQIQDKLK